MKSILLSIQPKWVAKILNGEKTIEIRKTMPKCDLPIDVYIYCTKDKKYANLINRGGFLTGMVVAKFTLNKVEEIRFDDEETQRKACLTEDELFDYLFDNEPYHEDMKKGYALHISDLKIFDKPKELNEFYKIGYLEERYAVESHLADIEGCDGGVNESYVDKLYEELDQEFQLTKAPQNFAYVEISNNN